MHVAGSACLLRRLPPGPGRPASHRSTAQILLNSDLLGPSTRPAPAAVPVPPTASETRVRFLSHAGASILLIDLSNLRDVGRVQAEIRTARDVLSRQPHGSQRTITLVDGAPRTPVILDALLDLGGRHAPRILAGAVVGMEGIHRALYRGLMMVNRHNIESFDRVDLALDWLAAQR